jgi:hypothetical protein
MALFMALTGVLVLICILGRGMSSTMFYSLCFALGSFVGYWAVFVTKCVRAVRHGYSRHSHNDGA